MHLGERFDTDSDSILSEFRMQPTTKPNVLKQAHELLTVGVLEPIDASLLALLFWETDGDGITTKRFSRNHLAQLLRSSVWNVRRSLRRLLDAGLLALVERPLRGKGSIFQVVGKSIYKKIKQRENERRKAKKRKRRGKRSYARLSGQTVRKTVRKPAPVYVPPPPTAEEIAENERFEKAFQEGGIRGAFDLVFERLGGRKKGGES